ncbi:phosphonoacetaldehyde hydrolase [Pelovirga terrestris]|uniref:phosphonoacetaldehyde hydrolase n=1 Tax=Pelovirga terrestris TaxID=2771352 RepID=A0A8J6QNG0_9BACT|nr:phosphonoacetaldehyde hydrolase [Pelovirga terrestris]MBD1400837.1 phosphonoacetaldehyde hydrolase [Pelovirga terrestris]
MFNKNVGLVVFDLAGTTVDYGCIAPVAAFVEGFRMMEVPITLTQARGPMGMEKRAHIRAIVAQQEVTVRWQQVHGRAVTEDDIDAMYEAFTPQLLEVLPHHCELIPGTLDAVAWLDRHGIPFATTTGYFKEAAEMVLDKAAVAGFSPHASIYATDVPAGRPAPWMIYRCMETLDVYPPQRIVNIGDTVVDVVSARNAGVWSIGVAASGNELGMSHDEVRRLEGPLLLQRLQQARQSLLSAGAHYVIDTVADLPDLIPKIEQRLAAGERP